jgi:hypothetical protein
MNNIDRKILRFKKMKNRPLALLTRLRDQAIPEIREEIDRINTIIDLRMAYCNAAMLLHFLEVKERNRQKFRRSYAYESFMDDLFDWSQDQKPQLLITCNVELSGIF